MVRKTVSLCMIVKNEEHHLRKCLESISSQIDEIIIVDTGSTDSTLTIAGDFGAKVFHYDWREDFADARNFSISFAKSDYVLVLDADEYIDFDSSLQETIKSEKDYYIINFKNYMDGGYVSNHQAIRLFKNNRGLKYYGKIHEHLNIEEIDNLSVTFAEFIIHHDGYKKETYNSKSKFDRNLKILSKEVEEYPTGYNLFNLGVQQKVGREYDKALKSLKKSFALSKDQIYLPYLLFIMGECLFELERHKEGIKLMNDSIDLFPDYTGYYYLNGLFYEKLSFFKAAEENFVKCTELGEVKNFQSLDGVGSYLAYIKLSEVQQKQGKMVIALESAFSALKLYKKFPPALNQYYFVMKSAGIKENDINKNLRETYPINETKDLEILISVLFSNRSPLLYDYINEYKLNLPPVYSAITALYKKEYSQASYYWQSNDIDTELISDVLALSIVDNNKELFIKVLRSINLSNKEKKAFHILINEGGNSKLSVNKSIFKIIKKTLLNFARLNEMNSLFEVYSKLIIKNEEKEEILNMLVQNGYLSECAALLEKEMEYNDENHPIQLLLADVYSRQNKLNEAYTIYLKLLNSGNYLSYNKLFCLYEKINYLDGMVNLEMEMKRILEKELNREII